MLPRLKRIAFRLLTSPPHKSVQIIYTKLKHRHEGPLIKAKRQRSNIEWLLKQTNHNTVTELYDYLRRQPFILPSDIDKASLLANCGKNTYQDIIVRAEQALNHEVNLLGSGPTHLGDDIDWHCDHKTGYSWKPVLYSHIQYNQLHQTSDVKFPWEVSRLQWLLPLGQAYLLTKDDRYALAAKTIIIHWIMHNPLGIGVNWACTMDVALRTMSLTWLFHTCAGSPSWKDKKFQAELLVSLYQHGWFIANHLERSDVNGNHFTTDACGLAFIGYFWNGSPFAEKWQQNSWRLLCDEIAKQTHHDGVNFEASTSYHRLVTELFFLPALLHRTHGNDIPDQYMQNLNKMAQYTLHYTKPDGLCPLTGDADDGRALPFGSQSINEHSYICQWITTFCQASNTLPSYHQNNLSEHFWLMGNKSTIKLVKENTATPLVSRAFSESGNYILQDSINHIFIDCGSIGFADRGGHGHNDCLSFEAVLNGIPLITDRGAYLYTADYKQRNAFRSTSSHNTPQINGNEINRFITDIELWRMHYDAVPEVLKWQPGNLVDIFTGSHQGFKRYAPDIEFQRSFVLCHQNNALLISDSFSCQKIHHIRIPLHFTPDVKIKEKNQNHFILTVNNNCFDLILSLPKTWITSIEPTSVSPSYGIKIHSHKLSIEGKSEKHQKLLVNVLIKPTLSNTSMQSLLDMI